MASAERRPSLKLPGVFPALALLALAGGCAHINYDPVPTDSPMPVLKLVPCQGRLPLNARCLALVRANQWFSGTGLVVEKKERYRIIVPPGQVWFDKGRRNVPPQGESGNGLMNLFGHLKRQEKSLWFSLIAVVLDNDADPRTEDSYDLGAKDATGEILIGTNGKLAMYPNDAKGLFGKDSFYRNNSGQIWVIMERCGTVCDAEPMRPE